MKWDCAQTEARLSDYLDATLAAVEQQAADAHIATCQHCATWRDARQVVAAVRQMELVATPPSLVTRILANTTGLAPQLSLADALAAGWRMLWQPRVALGLAAALFSLSLVVRALEIDLRQVSASDFRPSAIYRNLDRSLHVAYGRGVKFVNDLRLVYEIRSRLDALRPLVEESVPEPSQPPPAEKNDKQNFSDDGGARNFLAHHLPEPERYAR